jgi:addiction module HigA family antidote
MLDRLKNPHPGEILKEEFMDEMDLNQSELARSLKVPAGRINEIIRGRRKITADTDLRLCKFFSLSEGYWLRLQNAYDLMEAHRTFDPIIRKIHPRVFVQGVHL